MAGNDLINVMVDKGEVKLSGAIFDERERQAAIVAAENVAGVKAVKDDLFCADPVSVVLVVRRQIIWLRLDRRLAECRPHLGVDVKRRSCGAASADVGWFGV
nr:BON domain-containing protein [Mesorhizobium sp. PAMC28654]